jgi:chromatin structure-remodeling complex protein RSC7
MRGKPGEFEGLIENCVRFLERNMLMASLSRYNSTILNARRGNLNGVYDVHTNLMQYPKITQPSHIRWELAPPPDARLTSNLMKGMSALRLTNGTSEADESEPARDIVASSAPASSIFPPVPSVFSRRFAITDTHFESPESFALGIPGPDGDMHDLGSNGILNTGNPLQPELVNSSVLS